MGVVIGARPVAELAPLDYRCALDAAMPLLGPAKNPLVLCTVPVLTAEIDQRLGRRPVAPQHDAALWVEPNSMTWRYDLIDIAARMQVCTPLLIVISRPLARLLPEQRHWDTGRLGLRPTGIPRMVRGLDHAGFALEASYGFHTLATIGLNRLGQALEARGRPDLGDRLHFGGRLRYCTNGPLKVGATVGLLVSRKERA